MDKDGTWVVSILGACAFVIAAVVFRPRKDATVTPEDRIRWLSKSGCAALLVLFVGFGYCLPRMSSFNYPRTSDDVNSAAKILRLLQSQYDATNRVSESLTRPIHDRITISIHRVRGPSVALSPLSLVHHAVSIRGRRCSLTSIRALTGLVHAFGT
jgi:hypothetical protein